MRRQRWALALGLSLAPVLLGLGFAGMIQAGWLANVAFVGSYQADLAGLTSRVGLLLGLLGAAVYAGLWKLEERAERVRHIERRAQQESNRRFLRRLDHELKNPLTIIRLGLLNLRQELALDPAQTASLDRIAEQVQRVQRLVQDLRALADLDEMQLEREAVLLDRVLEEAMGLALGMPEREGRKVLLSFQNAPWPVGHVLGDRDLLVLAFRNLLDNALKFTPEEEHVEVRATDDGQQATVEVADTGKGIAADDLPHIFEELYRGEAASAISGSGLGLTLVRRIIELHGGEIRVGSRLEQGTLVSVRLPLASSDRTD